MKNNKWQAFWLADNFRLWRSWITQQIPILKNGGSNPLRRAKENDKFLSELVVFSYIRLQRVILLRSYICLATSDIRFASFNGEYNITETIRFQYHFHAVKISLCQRHNITKYVVVETRSQNSNSIGFVCLSKFEISQ